MLIIENLNSQSVESFWESMDEEYNSVTEQKTKSSFMKVIGWFLDVIGVQNKDLFMEDYATTIKRTIYVPFHIGGNEISLIQQVVTCVHEHQHIEQYNRLKGKYMLGYLFNSRKRALYEAEAYSTNIEIYYWLTGKVLNTAGLANILKEYGCDGGDINAAKKVLDETVANVVKGKYTHKATLIALEELKKVGVR
jgi:hypothetical protein